MKSSYVIGLMTGAILMLALIVFIAAGRKDTGRYQLETVSMNVNTISLKNLLDTKTGEVYTLEAGKWVKKFSIN